MLLLFICSRVSFGTACHSGSKAGVSDTLFGLHDLLRYSIRYRLAVYEKQRIGNGLSSTFQRIKKATCPSYYSNDTTCTLRTTEPDHRILQDQSCFFHFLVCKICSCQSLFLLHKMVAKLAAKQPKCLWKNKLSTPISLTWQRAFDCIALLVAKVG